MQVLFCHSGPLQVDQNDNYYGVSYDNEMFQRYKLIAENVATVIRTEEIQVQEFTTDLSEIDIPSFKVYSVPNIDSPKGLLKRNQAKEIIEQAVLESDYIVARLPSTIANLAIDYAIKHNKPYLTEVVGCPWDAYWNHSVQGKIIAPLMYLATKSRVKNSKYVVYVTNNFLQSRYPTVSESVNCSNVALIEFDESVLDKRLEKIKQTNKYGKIIIGTTAAVNVRYKGQEFVIKALGKLKKQGYTNYEYQLVGQGDNSYLKSIAEKYNVADQVKFLGPMVHKEVFDWLETIDIYTQPSKQEGLPRALIEAMSRGLPAFGANIAGIPELLQSDYLFNHDKNNINVINRILLHLSKKDMKEQAKRNFKESKKYSKKTIDDRRKKYFKKFKINEESIL